MAVAMIVTALSANAYEEPFTIDGITYSIVDGNYLNIEEVRIPLSQTHLDIPETIEHNKQGYIVKSIGEFAFYGDYAHLFKYLTIPKSLTIIDSNAGLYKCGNLIEIEVDENNPKYRSKGGDLYSKDKTELLHVCKGGRTNPPYVTTYEYKISDTVTKIGDNAFRGHHSLTSVTIPSSVTSIGKSAFLDCESLTSITIPNSVTTIGEYAFSNCVKLNDVTLSKSIKAIETSAFSQCTSLENIIIPISVTSIGDSAFSGCTSLTNMTIQLGVKNIGASAFSECYRLQRLDLPATVASIGQSAFLKCIGLKYIAIPKLVTTIEASTFEQSGLNSIYIGKNVEQIKGRAFWDCYLKSVDIPNSVKTIDPTAFDYCRSLQSISIGNSCDISADTFNKCESLAEIKVSEDNPLICSIDNVLYSKDKTVLRFYPRNRTKTSFSVPDCVKTIGRDSFRECETIKKLKIPDSVTSIGDYAFYDATQLEDITIGNNVTNIGYGAFYTYPKTIYCNAQNPPAIAINQRNRTDKGNFDTFNSYTYDEAILYVPIGCKDKYEKADGWNKFWYIKEMESGVEETVGEDMAVRVVNGSIVIDGVEDSCTIEVYDMTGKIVYNGAAADIPNMPRGIYVIRIGGKTVKVAV